MWYKAAQRKIMYILRGPSGSGKSTKAREMGISGATFSTDDFWMQDGQYKFDQDRISEAHEWNQQRVREALKKGISPVIIDNTNIEAWEMKNYVQMAQQYGYGVQLIPVTVTNTPEELAARNKHGVPADAITKMIEKYNPNVTIRDILKSQPPQKTAGFGMPYGEYWISNTGEVMYADGDIGEMGHAEHVKETIMSSHNMTMQNYYELAEGNYPTPDGSKDIYEALRKKGFKNPEIALLNGRGDPREYAMQNWNWKRVEGNRIETWTFTPMDLRIILQGLNDIAQEDETGESQWSIEVTKTRKYYPNIPLNVLEKGPAAIARYKQPGAFPMSSPNSFAGWFGQAKYANVVDGFGQGLNYQSYGHADGGWYLWWFDKNKIEVEEAIGSNIHEDFIGRNVLFAGRYNPTKKVVTVYNMSYDPLVDTHFAIVKNALYQNFGRNIKIFTFFEKQ